MRKKLFVLAAVIAALMALQSCKIPTAVEIKGSPDVSIPVNPDNAGVNDLITDTLKDTDFGDSGIKILNYTDYPGGLQAFLLHMRYTIDTAGENYADLQDNLDEVKNFNFELDTEELSQSIEIDPINIDDAFGNMEPVKVDLSPAFNKIRGTIQDSMTDPFTFYLPIAGGGLNEVDPNELVDLGFVSAPSVPLDGFGSLTIGAGTLKVTIRIANYNGDHAQGGSLTDVDITLGGLKIGSHEFAENFDLNNGSLHTATKELDLADTTIDGALEISIGKYTDNSDYTTAGAIVKLEVEVETFPDDTDKKIEFRKITNLEIDSEILPSVELDDIEDISLDFSVGGFLHAQLATGTLKLNLDMPAPNAPGKNSFDGITPVFENVKLMQAHSERDNDGTIWPGINASNALVTTDPPYAPAPWEFTDGDLSGKHLNTEDIVIQDGGRINLNGNNITVYMNSSPYIEEISVGFAPKIENISFTAVHVDIDDLVPEEDQPKIDIPSQSLADVTKYVKSITFNRIGPKLVFGQVDIANLEMKISVPALGINTEGVYYLIEQNGTIDELIKENYTLNIKDGEGDVLVDELVFDMDIRPRKLNGTGEGHVLEIRNFSTNTTAIQIEIDEETEIECDWASATIDLSAVNDETGGQYPKPEDDPIDLSEIGDMLNNFEFAGGEDGIQAWLYTQGPDMLFDFHPGLTLSAQYTGSDPNGLNLLSPEYTLTKSEPLVIDPDETGDFTGTIPEGGEPITNFINILNDKPDDLRLHYSMKELVITPDMLPDEIDLSGEIVIDILAQIPMRLTAGDGGDGGAKIEIPETGKDDSKTDKENDLLGRDEQGEDTFDWIKSMNLKVTLSDSLYEGAGSSGYFYLDDTLESGGREIKIPITGRTIQANISSEDLKYINSQYPYAPKMGLWFEEGTTLVFKRGTGIANVEVSADISYKLDLKDNNRAAGDK